MLTIYEAETYKEEKDPTNQGQELPISDPIPPNSLHDSLLMGLKPPFPIPVTATRLICFPSRFSGEGAQNSLTTGCPGLDKGRV